jgi:crossover junction endodeoxyribonuclease RusA
MTAIPRSSVRPGPDQARAGTPAGSPNPPGAPAGPKTPGAAVAREVSAAAPGSRTFTLEMPAGLKLVNANERYPHPAVRGRVIAELRKAAWATAHNALRAGRLARMDRVRIIVEYQPPRKTRRRDGGNWAPTGKALIDGCRDAGVIPDDDSAHVLLESYRIGEPFPKGRIVLFITEVPG